MVQRLKLFILSNKRFLIILSSLAILLMVLIYFIMENFLVLKGLNLYSYYILSLGIIILFSTYLCIGKYWDLLEDIFRSDMKNINGIDLIKKYKIKKPLKKEIDIGYITSKTSGLSNVLNIFEELEIIILGIIIFKFMNIISIIIGCIIIYLTFCFYLILESINDFYKENCDLINEELIINEDFEDIIKVNKVKIRLFMSTFMVISVVNLIVSITIKYI